MSVSTSTACKVDTWANGEWSGTDTEVTLTFDPKDPAAFQITVDDVTWVVDRELIEDQRPGAHGVGDFTVQRAWPFSVFSFTVGPNTSRVFLSTAKIDEFVRKMSAVVPASKVAYDVDAWLEGLGVA